jgi:VCBS repeat-containing protein
MADINGTDNDDVIRTAAAGGSGGGLPDATDSGDRIDPGPGADTVVAGAGDDTVLSSAGVDSLDGGDGIDTLDFTNAPDGAAIVLGQGDVFADGYGNTEFAYNFENALGSDTAGDPFLAGSGGTNMLDGQGGDDNVYGGGGDDTLYGRGGNDLLVGEEGTDTLLGGDDNDVLVGGRNDASGPNGQREDDLETDTLVGGAGYDTLILGVGDLGEGGDDDDYFEFAIDPNVPLDQQPLAVGTAVFAGDRADYDIRVQFDRVYVEDLVGNGGRDDVGSARLNPGGGPQVVAFLQFADQTVDVLNEVPGITQNQGPYGQPIALTMDAGGGIGTAMSVFDPEGDTVYFVGWTNGPANGTISDTSFDFGTNELSFSYSPDSGFIGTDNFDFLFQDSHGVEGFGTVTVNVVFDSAVADFHTVGVGRAFSANVGLNDADVNGDGPDGFTLVDPVPANASGFSFDPVTGDVSFTQTTPQVETIVFSYSADFPDGTSNTAPIFINFVELDETLIGDSGPNTIYGYGGRDVIEAQGGDDTIFGGDGDDLLYPGLGNDSVSGGAGFDRVVYSGLLNGFQITQVGFQVTVTDIDLSDGDEGTDTITGAELLLFANGQILGESYDVVANYDPLDGVTDGRLVNTLGGTQGFGENILNRNDDSSSAAINVTGLFGGALDFYGQSITQVFVNNNGNLTFTQASGAYNPQPLGVSTPYAIIAGIWADLDTRYGNVTPSAGGNSTGSNLVYWDLDDATQTFTATWDDVSYYSFGGFAGVAMQLQIVGRGGNGDFDIIYRFEHVDGSRAARSGFANQDDTAIYELPGSGTSAVGSLDTAAGNTGLPGVWIFSVRDGAFAPTASADAYTVDEDQQLVVAGPGVLGNDADPLARPLTATLYSNPSRGSVAFNADGSFTYTPNTDFNGTDSFQYQAATGQLASGPTTVTITVNGQNDAPRSIFINDSTTPENLVSGVNTGTGVTVGTLSAFDPESPLTDLAFSLVDDAGGRFVLAGRDLKTAGVLNYEDATFHDIVVRVTDPQGAFTDQTIRIAVENINEGPTDIFLTGTQAIYENLPPGTLIGTLSSNDAEGDPITYTRQSGPVNIVGDKVYTSISFDYEFQTQFTFTVRAAEPSGDGVDRQFTIFVDNLNEAPTAVDDVGEVMTQTISFFDVTANDFDPEGDPLAVTGFTQTQNGTLLFLGGGDFSYMPDDGFYGTDGFTYTVNDRSDGSGLSSTATVTLTVRPGDVIAVDDSYFTDEEQPIFFTVTSNDYLLLPDGSKVNVPLEASIWASPQHGYVVPYGGTPGQFAYYPDPDFYGRDSFTYFAKDQYSSSFFPATVTIDVININDDPYQTYIPEYRGVENRTLYGTFGTFPFIYDADRFSPADIIRNYVGTIGSTNGGTVVIRANGEFDYTPPQDFTGYDSFNVTYNDYSYDFFLDHWVENGGTHDAIIRINVEGEEPVAVDDRYTTYVGQTVYGGVLFNDRSPPGLNPLTADQAGGSIQIQANGDFTFVAQHAGTFIATYYAVDSAGVRSIDPAMLKITVLPDPPPPPPPGGGGGGAWGDPHLISHDGLYYDMQGWGEFVLTRATSGETFEVQIRTRAWVPGAQVTIVEAVAAAIDTHRVMAHVDGRVFVDGVATTLEAGTDPLLLSGNVRLYRTDATTYVFVDNDTGEQVRIEGVGSNNYMNVKPSVAPSRANAMEGILGDYDGSNANDIQLRDGTVLSQPVNIYDLYGLYAHDWRVSNAESLFVYGPGEDTDDFQVLNFPPVPLDLASLPTALVAAAAAQVAAAGITDPFLAQAAILDLLLTGDEGFIQGAQGADDPDDGLDVFVPPAPPLVGLASPLAAVAEGDAGTTTLTFTVFRTGNAADAVSVDWAVQANGLGFTDAADHGGSLPAGTVTLDIGETEKAFTVTITGDTLPELNESVRVALTATPAGYVVASGTGQGTVTNDDGPVLPDAIDDSIATDAGDPVVLNPLGNDLDPLGAGLSVSAVSAAANGTIVRNGNQITYTPNAGFSGQDSFTYTATMIGGGTDTATVTVNVAAPPPAPNAAPAAGSDTANATAGVELVILPGTLLANDSDADNDILGVAGIVQGPAHGTAQYLSESGVILYTPDAGFSGTDTIVYALSDGTATTPGIITITVAAGGGGGTNTPPASSDDAFAGDEDSQLVGNVLGNDLDADADALGAILVGNVVHGSLVLSPDGSFIYTPDADFNGQDSFTYLANDGTANGNIATVTLTVNPVNDAPVAQDDAFVTDEDAPLAGSVLLNDLDIDGPALVAALVAGPAHGQLVLNGDGGFLYVPDADFNGQDSFTYRAGDGSLQSATASVTITVTAVNDAPVNLLLSNVAVSENAGVGTLVGLLSATDVDGDPLTFTIQGVSGPFTIVGNQLRVAGPLDFEATPSYGLTMLATDPSGASTQLTATITIIDEPEQPVGDLGFRFSNGSFAAGYAQLGPLVSTGYEVSQSGGRTWVENIGVWNALKNVAGPLAGWSAALGTAFTISNFVDARMDFSNAIGQDLDLAMVGAKRGEVHTADGDDRVEVVFHSNGGTFREVFLVDSGAGDDLISARSVASSLLDDALLADNANPANGSLWRPGYDGHLSVLEVHAGAGDDTALATDVRLVAYGDDGDDLLQGGFRDDFLSGDAGNDVLKGGLGNDRLEGGAGHDLLMGEGGDDTIFGGDGGDIILGDDGQDRLYGGAGDDSIDGGAGKDNIQGGDGDDAIDGGDDDDVLLGQAGNDTIVGGAGNDAIYGADGDDVLDGGAGSDVIYGDAGNDRITGSAGLDTLWGAAGSDIFVLANRAEDRDWIKDFEGGTDHLEIDAGLFGGGLVGGASLDASRLIVGGNPVATQPGVGQFLYNTGSGVLRWDADGAGGSAPVTIATLIGVTALSTNDFLIV